MKKLVLQKLLRGKSNYQYRVYLDGKEIYRSSPTHRDYLAIALKQSSNGKFEALNRFGRVDLIGKGDSKRYIGKPDIYLAVRDDVEKHVRHLFPRPAGAELRLNDVMAFLAGADWNTLEAYMKENTPRADHLMERLARYANQYDMLSPIGLYFWLISMDQPHRDLIERYIIENHKQ